MFVGADLGSLGQELRSLATSWLGSGRMWGLWAWGLCPRILVLGSALLTVPTFYELFDSITPFLLK